MELPEFSKVIAAKRHVKPIILTVTKMLRVIAITFRKFGKFLEKPKNLDIINRVRQFFILPFLLILSLLSQAQDLQNAVNRSETPLSNEISDSTSVPLKNDTRIVRTDTIPSISDSTKVKTNEDIETTIQYSARDSIEASIDGKKVWLYGGAKIIYGDIQLEAEEIVIDYGENTLVAHGKRDSLGHRVGYPIFKDGQDLYETKDIKYNFKTGRAHISEVVTTQGEGYIHVREAFKNEDDELFSYHNAYTTCNLEHPHFQIISTRAKAIPHDKIVSGPFYLEFNGIPMPAGFLFGMFPQERESKSGIIFPSYGEERRRGFNLRRGGYFFDISDYLKMAIMGDIYSKGGHALYLSTNYNKRYKYNGSFNLNYTKTKLADEIENPRITNDYQVTWNHSPQSKGSGRFSASVNAATTTYNKNNNLNLYPTDINSSQFGNITAKLNSRVSYSKKFTGTPFSMSLSGSFNQDLQTRQVDMPFPTLVVNMVNQYPFQTKSGDGTFENFSIGYKMDGSIRMTNNLGRLSPEATKDSIAAFNGENIPLFIERAKKGIRHTIPISTSHKLFKYFTISPNINYDERWYFEKLTWKQDSQNPNVFVADTLSGFNRIANYSIGAGTNTRIFGVYKFKRGNVMAIRHVINPSISYSYIPDFTLNENYFQEFIIDGRRVLKSRHEGFVYGGSSQGKSQSLGFSIGNNVEMKIKKPQDSVSRKVMLLNNLSIGGSYNFEAEEFKLSTISLSANSNIMDNLININTSATLDPYQYVKNAEGVESRIDEYAWKGGKLGRITNASLALGTNLNPKGRDKDQASREKIAKSNLPEAEKEFLIQNPDAYVDFEIPWNLRVNYSLAYSRSVNAPSRITQSLQFSGDLALSEKWKIQFSSGYHFENKEFTLTTINITRDLHCWTMALNWTPFGGYQGFNFTIRVKSSLLQDLKLERRKPYFDNL